MHWLCCGHRWNAPIFPRLKVANHGMRTAGRWPNTSFVPLNPPVVNNDGNVICEMNFGPAQFSDILSLIQKGKAVSVYDLPYNPYINGQDKNL